MKSRISNVMIFFFTITLLGVLAFFVRIGATADSVAILKTTGMTCGSCANDISKALETVKGVAVTEVDVEEGWVIVGYDTKIVKPEALAEKVKGAGFGSTVNQVLTPEQFKQNTGRYVGATKNTISSGCCSGIGGGCGSGK